MVGTEGVDLVAEPLWRAGRGGGADDRSPGIRGGRHRRDAGAAAAKLGAAAVNQASLWNIANILTMVRLVLVPGFVLLMLADGGYDPAWRASPGRPSPSP